MNPSVQSTRPTALIVSPSLQGHRLTYCRVLTGFLHDLGFDVAVAGHTADPAVADDPWLAGLDHYPGVRVRDLGVAPGLPLTLHDLATTIGDVGADVTVLTEADDLIRPLGERFRRGAPALRGRIIALFIRSTNYIHRPLPSVMSRTKGRLKDLRDDRVSSRVFLEKLLVRRGLVDAALVLDERFAVTHASVCSWLPDIYHEFDAQDGDDNLETVKWRERLAGEAIDRPVLVYIGPSQARRGYYTLLRLAYEEDAFFLHCGEVDEEPADALSVKLRRELERRHSLLETRARYLSPDTADVFLRAARCVVLPYRRHEGSSGVMLQALAAGRPVLVPDRGLMAWRVRRFGLGETFREDDYADMRRAFRRLQARGFEPYEAATRDFMACFRKEQVAAAIRAAVKGGAGATLPQELVAATPGGAAEVYAGVAS